VTVVPGLLGDRYWVIEHADFGNGDPNYVYVDPAVTPGRINSYEFVEDLTGQFDPCGLGASGTLSTTFASNNGGTGNMFDVVTNDSAIEVTALDVNVAFAMGTQFTLSVYVAPSSFIDTITDDPVCTFNCSFDISAWTLVSTGTVSSSGQDVPTFVDVDDFVLDSNATTGIWVTLARDGSIVDEFRYTSGSNPFGNPDLTISEGAGVTGPTNSDPTEGVARDRQWNGTIYYNTR